MATISGTVYDGTGSAVAGRTVRAYRRDTGALLGSAITSDGQASPGDPHFSNVSLLLHMDGTNGSTTFTDSSPSPKTVTAYGNAQISTAQSKFGGSSAYFDGAGDYLAIPYTTDAFRWWGDAFTLEAFVFPVSLATFSYVIAGETLPKLISNSNHADATNYWCFGPIADGRVSLRYWNGAAGNSVASAATISENQWSHIALVVANGQIKIYVNGVGSTPVAVAGTPQDTQTLPLLIGATNLEYLNGHIDDLRITKGVARYTANFTPPNAAFYNAAPKDAEPLGSYTLAVSHDGEVQVISLDDAAGTTYNDLILRTTPV